MNSGHIIYNNTNIMSLIYSFDFTYKEKYSRIIKDLVFNIKHLGYKIQLKRYHHEKILKTKNIGLLDKDIKYEVGTFFTMRFKCLNRDIILPGVNSIYVITKITYKYIYASYYSLNKYCNNISLSILPSENDIKCDKEGRFIEH